MDIINEARPALRRTVFNGSPAETVAALVDSHTAEAISEAASWLPRIKPFAAPA